MKTLWTIILFAAAAASCSRSDSKPAPNNLTTPAEPTPTPQEPPPRPIARPTVAPSAEPTPAPGPAGPWGKVLLCHGEADRAGALPGVRIPVEGLFRDVQALTVELWFRPDALLPRGAPPEFLLSAHRQGDGRTDQNTDLSVSIRDGRQDRLAYFNLRHGRDGKCDGSYGTPGTRAPLGKGQWYHLAATYERTSQGAIAMQTFLGGERVSSSVTAVADEPCVAPLELTLCQGVTPTGIFTRPFVGGLDDVHISRIVRYRERFAPGPAVRDPDTLMLLRFDSGTVADDGPHALRGTLVGPAEVGPAAR